jgi:hypothetical protein
MSIQPQQRHVLRFIIFFLAVVATLVFGARDLATPQPSNLFIEADEHGLIGRPASLPLFYPNRPHVQLLHLRFEIEHHMFAPGNYLIRANCLQQLYLEDQLIYRAASEEACDNSWQTDLQLAPYLKPGTNHFYATVKTVNNEHVHFHVRACYVFGFC